jgi:hypothetical protein
MKILPAAILTLFLLQQAACTHLETCECDEIRALVNATVEEAISRLENKFSVRISNSDLTATIESPFKGNWTTTYHHHHQLHHRRFSLRL